MAVFNLPELEIEVTTQVETQTPAQFYAAWATELGLSGTGTEVSFDGDDFATALPFKPTSISRVLPYTQMSTEGGFGQYHQYDSSVGATGASYTGVSRAYIIGKAGAFFRPMLYLIWRGVDADLANTNGQMRKDNLGNQIIRGRTASLGDASNNWIEFAVRITGFRYTKVVLLSGGGSPTPKIGAWGAEDGTAAAWSMNLTNGQNRSFLFDNRTWELFEGAIPPFNTQTRGLPDRGTSLPPQFVTGQTALMGQANPVIGVPITAIYNTTRATPRFDRARGNALLMGYGKVAGTVKNPGTSALPAYAKVRLIRERDGMQVAEQWTTMPAGTYQFLDVEEDQLYTVLAYDKDGEFRAVLASNVVPVHAPSLLP